MMTYPCPIQDLLPQKNRMCLLDTLITADPDAGTATAAVTLEERHLFYDPETQTVPIWVAIELMAQTIAALSNTKPSTLENPISIGLLLGTRKLTCHQPAFPLGSQLYIHVSQSFYDQQLASFACSITDKSGALCYAEAELTVFHPKNPQEFSRLLETDHD